MAGSVVQELRRIVIKIGSTLLIDEQGRLNSLWLRSLAMDLSAMRAAGQEILLVSSGAVAIGAQVTNINPRRARLEELQAAAAAGQVQLVHAYQEELSKHGISAAQVLLTRDDTEIRRRFLNARGTLEKLMEHRIVAVINENDTVATDELRYGDNDRLAARVAQLVMADGLILLSDVDGLYSADPQRDPAAVHIPSVPRITDELMAAAGDSASGFGSGGMATKLQAARIATHAGCMTVIASGRIERPLQALADGASHSVFAASATPAAARKQWLAGMLEVRGELRLDPGAASALRAGSSLLPVGLVDVAGTFARGDAVALIDAEGQELGRGLASYASDEACQIAGCRSEKIEEILGYRGRSVLVHRDDLVLFADGN